MRIGFRPAPAGALALQMAGLNHPTNSVAERLLAGPEPQTGPGDEAARIRRRPLRNKGHRLGRHPGLERHEPLDEIHARPCRAHRARREAQVEDAPSHQLLQALAELLPRVVMSPQDVAGLAELARRRMLQQVTMRQTQVAHVHTLEPRGGQRQKLRNELHQRPIRLTEPGVIGPHHRAGISDLHWHAALLHGAHVFVAVPLGARVGVLAVRQRRRFGDAGKARVKQHAQAGDIDDVPDVQFARRTHHGLRAAHVVVVGFLRLVRVQRDGGGGMKHGVAAPHGLFHRVLVAQADHDDVVHPMAVVVEVAPGQLRVANQQTQLVPPLEKGEGRVGADKAGRTGHEDFHRQSSEKAWEGASRAPRAAPSSGIGAPPARFARCRPRRPLV